MGVGVDIESVHRFKENYKDEHFLNLIFTEREITYCNQKKEPYISFAGKFCAKEAVIKASKEKIGIKEIEIISEDISENNERKVGKPRVVVKGKEESTIKCSISHTDKYAVAFVVKEESANQSFVQPTIQPNNLYSTEKIMSNVVVQVNSKNIYKLIDKISVGENVLVSFGDVITSALAKSLKTFPEFNSNFDKELKIYPDVNIGYFINIDQGAKIAVINGADKKSVVELAKEVKNLALSYIRNELPDTGSEDYSIIIANLSPFNANLAVSPLFKKQSAVISIASELDAVEVINGEIVPAKKFNINLSFDVNVADCQRALQFMNEIKDFLEKPVSE